MLPSLDRLAAKREYLKPGQIRMLVLAPTRELAAQIAASARTYGKFMQLSVGVVFGGVPNGKSVREVSRGLDVLVATPGRLLDLVDQRAINLRELEILVLDEADQMLDLGFIHALKRIVALVPPKRQTLFFSATMPRAIKELADRYLTNPAEVSVAPVATTVERVEQHVTFVNQAEKQALLIQLLKTEPVERALVFSRTKHGADKIIRMLKAAGHRRQCDPRQQEPAAARAGDCLVPLGRDQGAGGDRHRGARHRHPGRQPRVQLRFAARARPICPPHRADGARRRDRHRDRFLLGRRAAAAARHRAADPSEAQRRSACRPISPKRCARRARSSRPRKSASSARFAVPRVRTHSVLRDSARRARPQARPQGQRPSGDHRPNRNPAHRGANNGGAPRGAGGRPGGGNRGRPGGPRRAQG